MKFELNKVYRDRIGQEWKIICKFESSGNLMAINLNQNRVNNLTEDGCYLLTSECEWDLIELVGDDFTDNKQLREFEFEAYIGERHDIAPFGNCIVQELLGCHTSDLYRNDWILGSEKQDHGWHKISKWYFTMKELPLK